MTTDREELKLAEFLSGQEWWNARQNHYEPKRPATPYTQPAEANDDNQPNIEPADLGNTILCYTKEGAPYLFDKTLLPEAFEQ